MSIFSRRLPYVLCTTFLVGLTALGSYAAASVDPKAFSKKEDVFIEANQLDYDHNSKMVYASGKVEIIKGETLLLADNVSYDPNSNTVTAVGNVVVSDPSGNTAFSDRFVLKDDLREGVIKYFRARMEDGSLIAAARAKRIDENKMILKKAVYSPCKVCNEDPESYPEWQLRAKQVTIDNLEQKVSYDDAYLDFHGIPVFYTPYFSHPTPNADRKSGFLTPIFRTDGNLGATLKTPYYWNIAPDKDLTFEPVTTSKEGLVVAGQFRHLTEYGMYKLYGSITHPNDYSNTTNTGNNNPTRGHLAGEGLFNITDNWDFGFDGEYASDDTYLRRYNYSNTDMLTSRAYFQRIKDRDYSNIQTVYFQGLLAQDDSKTTPFAIPYFQNHYEGKFAPIEGINNSKLWFDFDGFGIQRDIGNENQRVSGTMGFSAPMISSGGHEFEAAFTLRGDTFNMYDVNDVHTTQSRLIPEASLEWKYPLAKKLSSEATLTVEPTTKLVVSPDKNYNKNVPNEDSQDVEFSELNLFNNNRYRGIDQVESGTRMFYGVRGGYFDDTYKFDTVVGQNYYLDNGNRFAPANSGLNSKLSDYVGKVSANYDNKFEAAYRFRFDKDTLKSRRQEVDLVANLDPVELSASYFNLDYDYSTPHDKREEVRGRAKIKVAEEWSVIFSGTRNLADNTNIDAGTGLLYESDCLKVLTSANKKFISDRDAKSGASFNVQVGLKNMGEL